MHIYLAGEMDLKVSPGYGAHTLKGEQTVACTGLLHNIPGYNCFLCFCTAMHNGLLT